MECSSGLVVGSIVVPSGPLSPVDNVASSRPPDHSSIVYSTDRSVSPAQAQRTVGSIADYDPLNGNWGTAGHARNIEKIGQLNEGSRLNSTGVSLSSASPHSTLSSPQNGGAAGAMSSGRNSAMSPFGGAGFAVKAIYDYAAADKDEVSFLEGDIIVNCEKIDEGWMTGTVQRTLQWGMLPANYVQPHKLPTGLHRLS
ncbi:unnamed protein product [Caenorhabditis auriculariae]|uniref:SH3 domain-containing protein n=1 Tax=Caenorhabditis auriculariae TaxID=2777116 RepID=A0A8S1GYA8_9PELO|nr:unnamed protein product [Caenorhabditis auriculariae]